MNPIIFVISACLFITSNNVCMSSESEVPPYKLALFHRHSMTEQARNELDNKLAAFYHEEAWSYLLSQKQETQKRVGLEMIERIRPLLEKGADVNVVDDKYGETLLSKSAFFFHSDHHFIDFLFNFCGKDLDVNKTSKSGTSPLHMVCVYGHERTFNLFLTRDDLDVNMSKALTYSTPLHYACSSNKAYIVTQLLEREDIMPDVVDWLGRTPSQVALSYNRTEVINIFCKYSRLAVVSMMDEDHQRIETIDFTSSINNGLFNTYIIKTILNYI